jgi:hypothetical protein
MKKTPVLIIGMVLVLMLACMNAAFADDEAINQMNSVPLDMEIFSPERNYVSSTGKIPISLQSAAGSIVTVKVYPLDEKYFVMGSIRLNVRDMVVDYHEAVLPHVSGPLAEPEDLVANVESEPTEMASLTSAFIDAETGEDAVEETESDPAETGLEEVADPEPVIETIELPSLPSKMFSETIGQTGRWLYELSLKPGRYILLIQAEGNMRRSEEYAISLSVTSMERATEFLEMLEEETMLPYAPAVLSPIQRPLSMY